MFKTITDYRKVVLMVQLTKDDRNLLKEFRFGKTDNDHLSLEFKNILLEQHENYFDYGKDQEECNIEKILNK